MQNDFASWENDKTLLLSKNDIKDIFARNPEAPLSLVVSAFKQNENGDVLLPDKISQIFDVKTQNRINCMPATLISDKLCGVKWVSVFPENPKKGLSNVGGNILLSEIETGKTISIMDAAYITAVRTAAVGAVAAEYLAKADSETIGFIGAGEQAQMHFDMLKTVFPNLKVCYVSSRTDKTSETFIENKRTLYPDMTFINCSNNFKEAVINADIIVTATSSQEQLLKANYIKKGAFYIHVGGLEDEYAVAHKADKIVCDDWESIKHRTQTISLMYKDGELCDGDIYANLGEIISGKKSGREDSDSFIYFCSVGLAFIDIAFAKFVYEKSIELGLGTPFIF